MPRTWSYMANLEVIIKVSMLSSLLAVSTWASLVHTRYEDEMSFKGNYKFENRARSKTLIFKGSAKCQDFSVWPTHIWIV